MQPRSIRLKTPKPRGFPKNPQTLGEHLKRARLSRGLLQKDVARQIGVSPYTIINWEKDRTNPPIHCYPAVVRFLGYDPHPPPQTLGEQMQALMSLCEKSEK